MKILFVQTNVYSNNASGVPRVTYNLGKYFTRQVLKVAYFSFSTEGHINVEYGQLYHAKEIGGVNNKNNLKALKDCIADFKPDRVINQMPYVKKIRRTLSECSSIYNFKLIGCIHGSLFNFKNNIKDVMKRELPSPFNHVMSTSFMSKFPLLYHIIKQKIELTDMTKIHDTLLLNTPGNYEELKYFLKAKYLRGVRVDLMVNPVLHVQDRVPKKEKIILHLGRLNNAQKRSDLLLDFWEKTYKALPEWEFKVVGNGPYYETLVSDLKQRKLPRIELLGFQKAEPYYKEAAIFMMPSAYEGLPHTIIDSQSFGCPTLAFNSYAALEYIVNDGKNALLAKPYDTEEMAKLCINLAKDTKALAEMQKAALQNAENFSIQKVGKKWLELFKDLN
jgi:glycosyltransferase involved in cell wall biosynthesis